MIDPHVLHGGASSWLRIAANEDGFGSGGPDLSAEAFAKAEGPPLRSAGDGAAGSADTLTEASGLTPGPRLIPDT